MKLKKSGKGPSLNLRTKKANEDLDRQYFMTNSRPIVVVVVVVLGMGFPGEERDG